MYLSAVNDNFSGGITDFTDLGITTKYEQLKNIVVSRDGDALSRPGSCLIDPVVNRISSSTEAQYMIDYDYSYFICSSRQIFSIDFSPMAQTTMVGPTLNQAFTIGIDSTCYDHIEWQSQIYFTNDIHALPIKI